MTIELWPSKPVEKLDTSLGPMLMFRLTGAREEGLLEELGGPIAKVEPVGYVRALFRQVCCRENDCWGADGKPELPSLTTEEVESLAPSELEDFAKCYLKHNEWLRRGLHREGKSDKESDVSVPRVERMPAGEDSRKDGETAVAYLYRLIALKERHDARQLSQLLGPFAAGGESHRAWMRGVVGEALDVQTSRFAEDALGLAARGFKDPSAMGRSAALMESMARGAEVQARQMERMLDPFAAVSKGAAALSKSTELVGAMTKEVDQLRQIERMLEPATAAFKDPLQSGMRSAVEQMASLDHAKQMERVLDVSSVLGSESSAMSRSLMETLRQGQALSEFATRATKMVSPVVPDRPRIDIGELARLDAESKWAPFRYLGDKLDKQSEKVSELAAGVSQLARFAVQTNQTQTLIATETKRAAEDSRLSARRNLLINLCVLLVTVGSLVISAVALVRTGTDPTAATPSEGGSAEPPGNVLDPIQEHLGGTVSLAPAVSSGQNGPEGARSNNRPDPFPAVPAPRSGLPWPDLLSGATQREAARRYWRGLRSLPKTFSTALARAELLLDGASVAKVPTMPGGERTPQPVDLE